MSSEKFESPDVPGVDNKISKTIVYKYYHIRCWKAACGYYSANLRKSTDQTP